MSLKYIYSSLARAEPTHRCASNAPISPAHNYMFSYAERQSLKCAFPLPTHIQHIGTYAMNDPICQLHILVKRSEFRKIAH